MKLHWKLWAPLIVIGGGSAGVITWIVVRTFRQGDYNFEVFVKANDPMHPNWEDFLEQTTKKINESNLSQAIKTKALEQLKKNNKHIHFNQNIFLKISDVQNNGSNQEIVLRIIARKVE